VIIITLSASVILITDLTCGKGFVSEFIITFVTIRHYFISHLKPSIKIGSFTLLTDIFPCVNINFVV